MQTSNKFLSLSNAMQDKHFQRLKMQTRVCKLQIIFGALFNLWDFKNYIIDSSSSLFLIVKY